MNIAKYIEGSIWEINFGDITKDDKNGCIRGTRPALIIHNSMNKATVIPISTSKFHSVENKTYEISRGIFSVPIYQDVTTLTYDKFTDVFYGIMVKEKYEEILKTYFDILMKKKFINSELMYNHEYDRNISNNKEIETERINNNSSFNIDELSTVSDKKSHLQFMYTIIYSIYSKHLLIVNSNRYLKKDLSDSIGLYLNDNIILMRMSAHKVISGMLSRNKNFTTNHFSDLKYVYKYSINEGYLLTNIGTNQSHEIRSSYFPGFSDVFVAIDLTILDQVLCENGIIRSYMINSIRSNIREDMTNNPPDEINKHIIQELLSTIYN